MNICPFCHRRLLSQASPCCNWCGREIPDAGFQQQAGAMREAFFWEQAMHDAASLARVDSVYATPLSIPIPPRPRVVVQEPPPEDATAGRFRHLEL